MADLKKAVNVDNKKTTKGKVAKEEVKVETPIVDETPKMETPIIEIETPVKEETVDVEVKSIKAPKNVNKNVRIKMKEDHKCWVGSECFDLKQGQCYNVPVGVKRRLSEAGVLLPL